MKSRLALFGILLMLFFSCSGVEDGTFPSDGQSFLSYRPLTASFQSTRALIDDEGFGTLTWSVGDSISVFDSPSSSGGRRYETSVSGPVAQFDGQSAESSMYYALYPYSSSASFSSDVITSRVPVLQEARLGTFDPSSFLMVSKSSDVQKMGFYDALGGIRFSVDTKEPYTSVVFSTNNSEKIAGDVSIRFENGLPVAVSGNNGSNSITLTGDVLSGGYYYLSMIPQALSKGFTFSFYRGSTLVKKTVCNSFVQVKRYYFSTIKSADNDDSIAKIIDAQDLSSNGTSNCYLVNSSGAYKFPAVKGNSNSSVGNVSKVCVLWETDNTSQAVSEGTIISRDLDYRNGIIFFKVPDAFVPGNALIAALDVSGNVLWSWHIWVSDFDPHASKQFYPSSSSYIMDRNLGALSNLSSSPLSYGLFYQWGRKDPFFGSASLKANSLMKGTSSMIFGQLTSDCTISYSVQNPTTFICSSDGDWLFSAERDLWSTSKTMYDPCPPGWKVPANSDGGPWYSLSSSAFSLDTYYGGAYCSVAAGTSWYPCTGNLDSSNGRLLNVGTRASYWTSESELITVTSMLINLAANPQSLAYGVKPYSMHQVKGEGHSVRCVQE